MVARSGRRPAQNGQSLQGKHIDDGLSATERELEVVELIAQGLDNAEIASTLYMGEGTVRNHISSILQKLQLKNRTQIAVMYYRG